MNHTVAEHSEKLSYKIINQIRMHFPKKTFLISKRDGRFSLRQSFMRDRYELRV